MEFPNKMGEKIKNIFFICLLIIFFSTPSYTQEGAPLTYDLPLEFLMEVELVGDTNSRQYLEPTYDLSIEDLMALKIVKKLEVDQYIDFDYNIPLEDLMQIRIPANKKTIGIEPSYEMSLEGLLKLDVVENYIIVDKIDITYDISIDGLMKLSILRK